MYQRENYCLVKKTLEMIIVTEIMRNHFMENPEHGYLNMLPKHDLGRNFATNKGLYFVPKITFRLDYLGKHTIKKIIPSR